jgi:queuine/archaeosine tRNA-ribosyltransferase
MEGIRRAIAQGTFADFRAQTQGEWEKGDIAAR